MKTANNATSAEVRRTLDATDQQIVRLLNADGRSNLECIAQRVCLSQPAVYERIKRLEKTGLSWATGAI